MYNNPYLYNYFFPYQNRLNAIPKKRFFSGLFGNTNKINWGNLLNNTQKTLNVINQAIPVYYQIKPIYNNAKTMFRMVNAIKDDTPKEKIKPKENNKKNTSTGPVFYL